VSPKVHSASSLIVFAALSAGCGPRTESELARATSPDGKVVASLVQVDPGGGATVAFSDYVYLNEAGRDRRKTANFEGYSCGPVSIDWKDNQELEIAYAAGCRIRKFENQWWTSTDPTSARMVELELRRVDTQKSIDH
jgi:hypothetical protein